MSAILLAALLLSACRDDQTSIDAPEPLAPTETSAPSAMSRPAEVEGAVSDVPFVERAAELGVDFVHFNGMSGEYYYSEHMGGGAALFDYDQDGDLDLYLTQGHLLGSGKELADAWFEPRHPLPLTDRLYRNDLEGGRLAFTDVTEVSGLTATTDYGMGVAVGDYDNDGWPDLYVTNWGSTNRLLRNQGPDSAGRVTFADVTAEAGVEERRWSIAAVFFDMDQDGWLDLYVGNYLDYSFAVHKECVNNIGRRDYCGPASFDPLPDILFKNQGPGSDGRVSFADVTGAAGLNAEPAPTLGVVSSDYDGDGRIDLYLANDEYPNHLLLNQGAGRFRDDGLLAGCAMNSEGRAEAGMGVDAGDVDNDGDEDLFVSHLNQETNTLYLNDAAGFFGDHTIEAGLGSPSFDFTGFGVGFLDYDNDGWLDLLVANGAVQGQREQILDQERFPLHQKNQLFHNQGGGRFEDVSAVSGAAFEQSDVSRGAAFGDLDNDGDRDVVIHNDAGPVRLLINQVGQSRAWIGLRLTGGQPARDMLGAKVELLAPGPVQVRRVRTEGSYASANDPRVQFGLGEGAQGPGQVRVTWPDGRVETWDQVVVGRYTTLRQGEGASVLAP